MFAELFKDVVKKDYFDSFEQQQCECSLLQLRRAL